MSKEETRCLTNEKLQGKSTRREMINYGSVALEMPPSVSVKWNDAS